MKRAMSALIDAGLTAVLAYGGFRLGTLLANCKDPSSCPVLTPLIMFGVILAIGLYFAVGHALWGCTFGQRLLGTRTSPAKDDVL